MATRARKARARQLATRARTRTSTRAVTTTRARNETVGTVVNSKYNSRVNCSKWRHKRADCRTRLAPQKHDAAAGFQEPESEVDGVKSAQWCDGDSDAVEMDSSSWCFAAMNTPRGLAGTLLFDSGADDHIFHPGLVKESPLKRSVRLTLRDVQGNKLPHHGTRHVILRVGTQGQRANIDFQIADKPDNVLSLGKLLRNGFVFILKGETDSIMYHQSDPTTTAPSFLHTNSLRIRANSIVRHVSLVAEDDMPLRLSSQSPSGSPYG